MQLEYRRTCPAVVPARRLRRRRRMNADCVIVGGGISGLSAGHELRLRGIPFVLVVAGGRFGGLIRTERVDGFVVDAGADALLMQKPAGIPCVGSSTSSCPPARAMRALCRASRATAGTPRGRRIRHSCRLEVLRAIRCALHRVKTPHGRGIFPAAPAFRWRRVDRIVHHTALWRRNVAAARRTVARCYARRRGRTAVDARVVPAPSRSSGPTAVPWPQTARACGHRSAEPVVLLRRRHV